jgi:arylsulfatase A-like enzyme
MNRRTFLSLSSSMLVASGSVPAWGESDGQSTTDSRPNFLFIIADDLMYRTIRSINNPEVSTPNIDRLVQSGCHFTHCFHQGSWTGAVCVASRTMLNTGLSSFRAQRYEPSNPTTVAPLWGQTLRAAGYETFITGKWHLDPVSLQRCFSEMGPVAPGFLNSTPDMYNRPAPGNQWIPQIVI